MVVITFAKLLALKAGFGSTNVDWAEYVSNASLSPLSLRAGLY